MTLKRDAIFKEKLTGGLKNAKRILTDIHPRGPKSKNLHFDGLVLPVKSKTRLTSSNRLVEISNPRVTSSNPRVRRLKPRVARLKARVSILNAQFGRLNCNIKSAS